MDKKHEGRKAYWQNILSDWQDTQLSLAEFARKNSVSYDAIWWWKKQLGIQYDVVKHRSKESKQQLNTDFVPVQIIDSEDTAGGNRKESLATETSRLEVLLRCGHGMRFDSTCSLQFVQSVVKLLEVC